MEKNIDNIIENNNLEDDNRLKIEKISKYKKEKKLYNGIAVLSSILATIAIIMSTFILIDGMKGNNDRNSLIEILVGLFGILTPFALYYELLKENRNLNQEYDEAISNIEKELNNNEVTK